MRIWKSTFQGITNYIMLYFEVCLNKYLFESTIYPRSMPRMVAVITNLEVSGILHWWGPIMSRRVEISRFAGFCPQKLSLYEHRSADFFAWPVLLLLLMLSTLIANQIGGGGIVVRKMSLALIRRRIHDDIKLLVPKAILIKIIHTLLSSQSGETGKWEDSYA